MIKVIADLKSEYYIYNLIGQPESKDGYNFSFLVGNRLYTLVFDKLDIINDKKENENKIRIIYEMFFGTKETPKDIQGKTMNLKQQSIIGTSGASRLFNMIFSIIKEVPNYKDQVFMFEGIEELGEKLDKRGFSMRSRLYLGIIRQIFKGSVVPFRHNGMIMFSFSKVGFGKPL